MIELKGKYNSAIVHNDEVEQEAISQIYNMINNKAFSNGKICIMPDCHYGKGSVIGFTMEVKDKVCPSTVGVDIGCSVNAWKLGKRSDIKEKFDKLDKFIRSNVPSGRDIRDKSYPKLDKIYNILGNRHSYNDYITSVINTCATTSQDYNRVLNSIGSLGGGNHFIEIDKDDNDCLWLVIHSGSRNFGYRIAAYHQRVAEDSILGISKDEYDKRVEGIKATKKGKGIEVAIKRLRKEVSKRGKTTGLEYLEGNKAKDYFYDMNIAQIYAQLNRRAMGHVILDKFYKLNYKNVEMIESVHNYINFEDNILRKGAISAHKGERVIIPLNMADGCIIGVGKGNEEWNYSAPHGLGRKLSRAKAKAYISIESFKKRMKDANVWSSCVNKSTLDEAPQAYKKPEHIIKYLKDTIDIKTRMNPVYNFKG